MNKNSKTHKGFKMTRARLVIKAIKAAYILRKNGNRFNSEVDTDNFNELLYCANAISEATGGAFRVNGTFFAILFAITGISKNVGMKYANMFELAQNTAMGNIYWV